MIRHGVAHRQVVLVVDDEMVLRQAVASALRDEGYTTIEGADGRQAVDLVAREHPDLVLMDVMMPVLDGREAYRAIRRSEGEGAAITPIIMMSAVIGPDLLDAAIAGFVAKPFDLDRLIDLVISLIGHPTG